MKDWTKNNGVFPKNCTYLMKVEFFDGSDLTITYSEFVEEFEKKTITKYKPVCYSGYVNSVDSETPILGIGRNSDMDEYLDTMEDLLGVDADPFTGTKAFRYV